MTSTHLSVQSAQKAAIKFLRVLLLILLWDIKKDDKATFKEITQRNIELKDFLRRYFTKKTAAQLRPQNENNLKSELKNAINNKILSSSKIEDISFLQLDVVEQQ